MPDFTLGEGDDRPALFDEEDPLVFHLKDLDGKRHTFRCEDYPQLPDDSRGGLSDRPRWYLIESMACQVEEEQRDRLRELADELMEAGQLRENAILELLKNLNAERRKAEKAAMRRKTRGRPTGEPSGSIS
jgi:coenzyme F420-reducing hydrogenase alpha subunit